MNSLQNYVVTTIDIFSICLVESTTFADERYGNQIFLMFGSPTKSHVLVSLKLDVFQQENRWWGERRCWERGFEKIKQIRLAPMDEAELVLLAVDGTQQKTILSESFFERKENEECKNVINSCVHGGHLPV